MPNKYLINRPLIPKEKLLFTPSITGYLLQSGSIPLYSATGLCFT